MMTFANFILTALFLLEICILSNGDLLKALGLPPLIYSKDPDVTRSVVDIIESRGFKAETHYVTTEDGYILTHQRIVNLMSKVKVKRPVIVQHGVLSSSYDFINNAAGLGTENSDTFYKGKVVSNNLGFALAMFDFDVWLTNSRGNLYGLNHTKLDPKDEQFWMFTSDEMSEYDLPATIRYIRRATKHDKVAYVGHSQGTSIMFKLLSQMPQYSEIVQPFIALAPVVKVTNVMTPLKVVAYSKFIRKLFYDKPTVFPPKSQLFHNLGRSICKFSAIDLGLCFNAIFVVFGFDPKQLDLKRVQVYAAHAPATTSTWNMLQYAQMFLADKFQKFDHGKLGNLKRYNSTHPPEYDLKNITSKSIALFAGLNDFLAAPKDVQFIRDQLGDKIMFDYVVPVPAWNHGDFLWAKQAAKYVNVKVIEILIKYKY